MFNMVSIDMQINDTPNTETFRPASFERESSDQVFFTSPSSETKIINNSKEVKSDNSWYRHSRYSEEYKTGQQSQRRMTGRLVLGNLSLKQKIGSTSKSSSDMNDVIENDEERLLYLTRHKIDHVRQSVGVCREVMFAECVPCCDPEARERRNIGSGLGIWMFWSIIRSELFIYGLHIFSLALGATKEVISEHKETPNLELIQSVIETAATLLLVTIRMANAYAGYRVVRSTSRFEENYDPDKDINVQKMKRWLIVYLVISAFLFAFSVFAFLWFYFRVHLGWTILTNNFCMISMFALSTIFAARVVVILTRIREDQHKVVIHEAVVFIEEANEAMHRKTSSTDDNGQAFDSVGCSKSMVFVRALRSTKLFDRPGYIEYLNMA